MKAALVLGLLVAVACEAQQPTDAVTVRYDRPGVHTGDVRAGSPAERKLLAAQADTVEHIFQVTLVIWHPAAGDFPQDSILEIEDVVACPDSGATIKGIARSTCPDPRAPTVHTHILRKDTSPSPIDLATQVRENHRWDAVFSGGVGTVYWLDRNPLIIQSMVKRLIELQLKAGK